MTASKRHSTLREALHCECGKEGHQREAEAALDSLEQHVPLTRATEDWADAELAAEFARLNPEIQRRVALRVLEIDTLKREVEKLEQQRDALEELQPFPVSTVMSWKRRAESSEALMRYARLLLDPDRQDEPDEENALRAFEALSGIPVSVEARHSVPERIDETDLLVQELDELNLQNEALGNDLVNLEAERDRLREALQAARDSMLDARDELGVPSDDYPAPIANAHAYLTGAITNADAALKPAQTEELM